MSTETRKQQWKAALERRLGVGRIEIDLPLAPLTTFRIGGPADLLFRARSPQELVDAITAAKELQIPTFLLGKGANILVADDGFRGLVIRVEIGGIMFLEDDRVRVGAGVAVFPELIEATVERGLGGLHHFVGIPSTVGGAIWQNLHFLSPAPDRARTVFIEEVVESAEIFSEEGRVEEVDRAYFRFGYDFSILHERSDVVLNVTFILEEGEPAGLRQVMEENLRWRAERHPDLEAFPSAGSIFKKVGAIGAGRLIDECGLKGRIRGGAQIFPRHANIIVNLGNATAADVLALIEMARETVLRQTGHELVPEITLVGEFGIHPPQR
ncbi:MAG: UDP-N-acetylmuramate dehydrogenase [Longimicrobiales bacterium]